MESFRIDVPDADLDDLVARLRRTRWSGWESPASTAWDRGIPLAELRSLAAYWAEEYDWRRHEARVNEVPQLLTEIDGQRIHLLHARSEDPTAVPMLLTHGWPGSVVEFLDVLGPLTAPGPGAVHAVVPALPGFGFSSPLAGPGWGVARIARAWVRLMDELGYERFAVQGGDWGSGISRQVAVTAPDRVVGAHLNMYQGPVPRDVTPESDLERRHLARRDWFFAEGRGYNTLQGTRPDTVGHAMADSPVGQLAWIAEKFHDWTDTRDGATYGGIDRDTLLTNVSLYWLTNTAASSAQIYYEARHDPLEQVDCPVPMAMAVFDQDLFPPLRRHLEPHNRIVSWQELERGGHFAALEQPEALVADIRRFVAGLRGGGG